MEKIRIQNNNQVVNKIENSCSSTIVLNIDWREYDVPNLLKAIKSLFEQIIYSKKELSNTYFDGVEIIKKSIYQSYIVELTIVNLELFSVSRKSKNSIEFKYKVGTNCIITTTNKIVMFEILKKKK